MNGVYRDQVCNLQSNVDGKVNEFAEPAPEKVHTIRRSTLTARPSKELTPGNKMLGLPASLVSILC